MRLGLGLGLGLGLELLLMEERGAQLFWVALKCFINLNFVLK